MEQQPLTLLCFGHLNWDHVWQRPQQLMSRFAKHCRVIYVDPPDFASGVDQPYLEARPSVAGVERLRPFFPTPLLDAPGNPYQQFWLRLLPEVLAEAGANTIQWVFSPRADYLVEHARPNVRLAVYDCMDDLASFRDGSEELRQRETRLLELVDLVFTGGHSMYEARKNRHSRIYCFPSGVDVDHYRTVQDPSTVEPAVMQTIPHPRLGYFGVLDERIDWELIGTIAESRPDWQWALVGPTAKVDPNELPVAPNIHYFGQQQYADLPAFLKGFDIATMPFALNEATRFISPTKTLEYLAGGKPVISSSVPDVVALYGEIVHIVDGPDAWMREIDKILVAPEQDRQARLARATEILARSSWDSIAEQMWTLMHEQLVQKP
jgi:glycosyltransferase involved in cell wall biosynthesis